MDLAKLFIRKSNMMDWLSEKMPERKQLSMRRRRKKTYPPNLQLISWPEQHHHISSSRTKPVSDIERIHSVSD